MIEFTKSEKKLVKELIKTGILRRHAEWLEELKKLLNSPFEEGSNEFDRSMEITKKSHHFYKEAMRMEEYYSGSNLFFGILNLYNAGYLTPQEISTLPEKVRQAIKIWNREI